MSAVQEKTCSSTLPLHELIQHILERYHETHRRQLSELTLLASCVHGRHIVNPQYPNGLTQHLVSLQQALESHMQKEEQILFPMLLSGRFNIAYGPINAMCLEHDEHVESLQNLRDITNNFRPPSTACNRWYELYEKLIIFEQDLVEHINIENNILFPQATA